MITPDGFLSQAKWLLNSNSSAYHDEVNFRSAISRAYYSLYHEAYGFLKIKYRSRVVNQVMFSLTRQNKTYDGNRVRSLDDNYILQLGVNLHSLIPQVLFDIQFKLGQDFKQFRRNRDDADYELSLIFGRTEAEDIIDQIEKLIQNIKAL